MINTFGAIIGYYWPIEPCLLVLMDMRDNSAAMYYKKEDLIIQEFLSDGLASVVYGSFFMSRLHQRLSLRDSREVIRLTKEYREAKMYYKASLVIARSESDQHERKCNILADELAEKFNIVADFTTYEKKGFEKW